MWQGWAQCVARRPLRRCLTLNCALPGHQQQTKSHNKTTILGLLSPSLPLQQPWRPRPRHQQQVTSESRQQRPPPRWRRLGRRRRSVSSLPFAGVCRVPVQMWEGKLAHAHTRSHRRAHALTRFGPFRSSTTRDHSRPKTQPKTDAALVPQSTHWYPERCKAPPPCSHEPFLTDWSRSNRTANRTGQSPQ